MPQILVGTKNGLHRFDAAGRKHRVEHEGRTVTMIAPEGFELWAILDGREIVHTAGIEWWFHVADFKGFKGTCMADTRAGVIAGSSRAHLFRIEGEGLERVTSFDKAPGRNEWFTPWGGPPDTRSITEDGDTVYVNVHVGGVLRSRDHGDSWEPTIEIETDIHRVTTGHGRVYAAGGNGLHISKDKGATWTEGHEGLHARYCRAVTVCGDAVLLSASTGPDGKRSAVYRGDGDGASFEKCTLGVPEWFKQNIDSYSLDSLPDGKLAAFGTEEGQLFASTDQGRTWTEIASGLPEVMRVLVAS